MLQLKPFSETSEITDRDLLIEADLQFITADTVELTYSWTDKKKWIHFEFQPAGNRVSKLWEQTCFEAFIQPVGSKRYFEINLTINKSWNAFEFSDYRNPQPPNEFSGAELIHISIKDHQLKAQIKFEGVKFNVIKASLCSVIFLKNKSVTYWSTRHADQKPNFHHFDSFTIERKAP